MPHQKAALLAASRGGIVHKISDEARRQQPFDAFKLSGVQAYVVACFGKECTAIRVEHWNGASMETRGEFSFKAG